MNFVDLHVHSTKSDGTFTPSELVQYAIFKGLTAFALTDHDTTAGIEDAIKEAEGKNIEVIPGIECSTIYFGKELHILGLFIDYHDPELQNALIKFHKIREDRNEKMAEKLREKGLDISMKELKMNYQDSVITRGHIARYLMEKGYVKSMKDAFDQYIGDRAGCLVKKDAPAPEKTIAMIRASGGVPILAHPLLYHLSIESLDKLVRELKQVGLMGIEGIYSLNKGNDENNIRNLARKYNLVLSGGSDFHGDNKPQIDLGVGKGNLQVPEELLSEIKKLVK